MEALINASVQCDICKIYLRRSYRQCRRSHHFCHRCIQYFTQCILCDARLLPASYDPHHAPSHVELHSCKYATNGCTARFQHHQKLSHEQQCPFQKMYACEYAQYCRKECAWQGPYIQIEHHFQVHARFRLERQPITMRVYLSDGTDNGYGLTQAFDELFYLKVRVDAAREKMYFVFQQIDKPVRESLATYVYDFEIINLHQKPIYYNNKRVIRCHDKIYEVFRAETCVVATFTQLERYITNNLLRFKFRIRKIEPLDEDSSDRSSSSDNFDMADRIPTQIWTNSLFRPIQVNHQPRCARGIISSVHFRSLERLDRNPDRSLSPRFRDSFVAFKRKPAESGPNRGLRRYGSAPLLSPPDEWVDDRKGQCCRMQAARSGLGRRCAASDDSTDSELSDSEVSRRVETHFGPALVIEPTAEARQGDVAETNGSEVESESIHRIVANIFDHWVRRLSERIQETTRRYSKKHDRCTIC